MPDGTEASESQTSRRACTHEYRAHPFVRTTAFVVACNHLVEQQRQDDFNEERLHNWDGILPIN